MNIDFYFKFYISQLVFLISCEFWNFPELTKRAQILKYKQSIKNEIINRCEIEKWHDSPSASFGNMIEDVRECLLFSNNFDFWESFIKTKQTHLLWNDWVTLIVHLANVFPEKIFYGLNRVSDSVSYAEFHYIQILTWFFVNSKGYIKII